MSNRRLFVACLCLAAGSMAPSSAWADWKIPPQVELRVPFEPTAFPGKGQTLLMYEIYLTNYSGKPVDMHRIEVAAKSWHTSAFRETRTCRTCTSK